MATIFVKRPKLAWHESWFISTFAKGLKITLGHALKTFLEITGKKEKVTMEYPEQKWDKHLPEYYRGAPALVTDEQDRERCVSCQLCVSNFATRLSNCAEFVLPKLWPLFT